MKQSNAEMGLADDDGPIISDNVIRIQLREPRNRKWELCTRNCSPGRVFPTIQLFDCDGNLLVETNDDNLSIKSTDFESYPTKRHYRSLGASDFAKRQIAHPVKKNNTISGDNVYTRFYKRINSKNDDDDPFRHNELLKLPNLPKSPISSFSSALSAFDNSEFDNSSIKSSDNESSAPQPVYNLVTGKAGILLLQQDDSHKYPNRRRRTIRKSSSGSARSREKRFSNENSESSDEFEDATESPNKIHKTESCHLSKNESKSHPLRRSKTEIVTSADCKQTANDIGRSPSFLETYLRSLPKKEHPKWLDELSNYVQMREKSRNKINQHWRRGMIITDDMVFSTDPEQVVIVEDNESAVEEEIKRRLKKYERVLSCSDYWTWKREPPCRQRRYSEGASSESSESFDEADRVLMRLKRRILQNKKRERRGSHNELILPFPKRTARLNHIVVPDTKSPPRQGVVCGRKDAVSCGLAGMGASASRQRRGLGGRRAQSSGDLCNGNGDHHDGCSVAGSTAGDASTWNSRSLPSHLDGRRRCHCGECGPTDNNSCGAPTPRHPRHLHKFNHHYGCKSADLEPVWKLQDPGCDQGYGSERSPEEEFPPSMPVEEEYDDQDIDLRQMYPFITDENTFTVRIEKDRRGLGLSVAGGAIVPTGGIGRGPGLVRIRRLYAAQPAWATGQLRPGDLLLAANGISLAGLTTYEALEVLRTTPPIVELVVCRPEPEVLECLTPPGGPPEPPLRQPPPDPLNLHPRRIPAPPPPAPEYEEPQPIFDVKFGEFDIVMTKVNGSLGFTLRKEDHSALGHYVRALVREPALSDGRIQPGDRIVAVNDVPMSTLSHGEAVSFLRRCGPVARLRLYRDHCGTPPSPSAASPTTESDTTLTRPKPPLRQEAVNMLCDIAARKLTPDDGNGSRSPCLSPRRFKKPTRNSTGYSQNSDTMHPYSVNCPSTTAENSDNELSQTLSYQSTDTADTTYSVVTDGRPIRPTCFNGQLFENIKPPSRPDFLDLGGPPTPVNNRKQRLHFSVAAHGYELNNLDNDVLDAPNIYQDISQNGGSAYLMSQTLQINEMSNEPMSMPIELNSTLDDNEARFSHKNPAYQSAVVHPSTNCSDSNKDEANSMKKWKCVTLSPENERKFKSENSLQSEEPEKPKIVHYPDENKREPGSEPRILTVELNRGWNSRLGFSVQCHPESGQSYISAIYSDSVAAKDGRLRQGDIILQVNDENITSMTTPQVIDLLRILRGSICITVLRQ